jgi:hypothetical protein
VTSRHVEIAKAARMAAPLFAHHHWRWGVGEACRVPSEGEIALAFASRIAEMEKDAEITSIRSGRLSVRRVEGEEGCTAEFHLCVDLGEVEAVG